MTTSDPVNGGASNPSAALYSAETVATWLTQIEQSLLSDHGDSIRRFGFIGIQTGGVEIARRLHQRLGNELPLGELNISFYRDDFSSIGLHPVVGASKIPFNVDNQTIVLIDDVLDTGRTIRAALNEIFDYGRPARVILAVLVDREGRELPIRADACGHTLTLPRHQRIKLNCETMECVVIDSSETADS